MRRPRLVPWLTAAVGYATLTIVLTWPLVTQVAHVLPHDLGDPMLNTWILWWNAHAVPLTETWWNAPMFSPATGVVAFSENLLGLSVLATPIQWLGGGPVTAYNVVFLLSFPFSALAAHALALTLTGRHDAATLAGLIFGFNPYRIAHLPQIQLLVAFWMPVALVALHAYMRGRQRRWLVLFGTAWLLQALSNGYYLLFFPVLLALWVAWFVGLRQRGRPLAAIAATWIMSSLPLIPLFLKYRAIHERHGLQRDFGEIDGFGADLTSFLDASPLLKFWKLPVLFHRPEGELFPGAVAVLLVVVAVLVRFFALRAGRRARATAVLLAVAIVFATIALSASLAGPWSLTIAGRTLLSVTLVAKPLSIACIALLLALACEPRVIDAARTCSALGFYALATAAMYLLSLGPRPRFLGSPFLYQAPYTWLIDLPGYSSIRVPARFAMLGVLCLAVAASLGFAWLTSRLTTRARWAVAAVAIAGIAGDSWIRTLPQPRVPLRYAMLESAPSDARVMELPLGGTEEDTAAMYRSTFHRRTLINGYSGFFPLHYTILAAALEGADQAVLGHLAASTPLVVVVDMKRDGSEKWSQLLAKHRRIGEEDSHRVFLVGRSTPESVTPRDATPRVGGPALPVAAVSVSAQEMYAKRLFDGDTTSGWQSGAPQNGTEWIVVDVGAVHAISGIAATLGPYLSDYPRILAIDTSEDGQTWTTRWTGPTAVRAIIAAETEPREPPLRFSLGGTPARFVRLRQLGTDPKYFWSIAELGVFGR